MSFLCGDELGVLFIVAHRLLTAPAPLVTERRFYRVDFSSCGLGLGDWDSDLAAQRVWNPPRPVPPALGV